MAATKAPANRLSHILRETTWMRQRLVGMDREIFLSDVVLVRAAERGLLIISEAAKALPDELLSAHPDVPWHAVRALGNVLRHAYDQIEPPRLWEIISHDIPDLDRTVRLMLADLHQAE